MVGLVAGVGWALPFEGLATLAVAAIVLALFLLVRTYRTLATGVLFVAIFLSGVLAMNHLAHPAFPSHHITYWASNQRLTVEGYLYQPAQLSADSARLHLKAQSVWANGKRYPTTGNILITVQEPTKEFLRHDRIVFSSRLRRPRNFSNPGSFDFVRWLAFKEIAVTAYIFKATDLAHVGVEKRAPWLRTVDRFRATVRRTITATVSEPSAFLLQALLLGDRKTVPDRLQDHFSRSGTAHVLAISGLHVGIVAGFCFFVFRWLLSRSTYLLLTGNVLKLAAALSLLPILAYTLIAGAGLSAQRAFIMVAVYIAALLVNRANYLYNALALAAFIILAIQPAALWDVSFQLSFMAVLGIIFVAPHLLSLFTPQDSLMEESRPLLWRTIRDRAVTFLVVSFSAMLATGPLVAYHFSYISLIGLAANIFLVPLVALGVVPVGLTAVVLLPLSSTVAETLFQLAGVLAGAAASLAGFFSELPAASFLVTTPTVLEVAFLYAFVVSILLWKFYRVSVAVFLVSLLLLVSTAIVRHYHLRPSGLQTTFLDVGQGDAAVVRFPEGTTMLIDGGGFFHHNFDTGKNIVAPFLLRNGIRCIDYLVMTHPHPDHYDGLRYIAQHFCPRVFWTNGDTVDDPFFVELQEVLAEESVPVRIMDGASAPITIGGVVLRVLHPPAQSGSPSRLSMDKGLNNRSLVIKLSYGNAALLFTGDIHASAERSLLTERERLFAPILKVPHHGSLTSSSPGFIEAVKPRIAICMAGYRNRFNLPHKDIVSRYEMRGCTFLRTDRDGAVMMKTDGENNSHQHRKN